MFIEILFSALALLFFMTFAFLVGTIKKDNSVIDIFYGLGYVVLIWASLLFSNVFPLRKLIITSLVTLWGLRLAIYVMIRNWGKPEDYRYQTIRKKMGDKVILKSFLRIYMFQGLIIFLVGFPELFANVSSHPLLNWLDILGLGLWIVGFYFEAVGDYQLRKFLKNPENKGKIMDQGLWKYTQHPNYFGEVLMWWSLFLIVVNVEYGVFMIFGPIIINYMIIKVSGVRLLNKRFEKDDKYADYRRRTSTFIPWFPKKKKDDI
jgi:steroid 5-alpha reductase family enzyme